MKLRRGSKMEGKPVVALYARVSTRHQAQEATIESQVAQLLGYAQAHGYEIAPEHRFLDQAVSGKRLERPGLDRLRDAAANGEIQRVLCVSPDRLARSLGVQQVLLAELHQVGVEVVFLTQPVLKASPQAEFFLHIQGAVAEYERAIISDRLRGGKLYRLSQGQSVPGHPPYGYRYQPRSGPVPAAWVIDPAAAAVVQQLFLWYAEAGWTASQIAQQLNEQQTPGPEGKGWSPATVRRLLRQSAYRGLAYYNRYQYAEETIGLPRRQGRGRLLYPRPELRPEEEWIAVVVPAIVETPLWEAAQEQSKLNARFAKRHSQRPYLLRGLLVCGVCGHTLQGRTQRGRVTYFCPYGGSRRAPNVSPHTCVVEAETVEPAVWNALADLLRDPQRIQLAWEATTTADTEIQVQQQRLTALRRQSQRLVDAYQADALTLSELVERRQPLQREIRTLELRLAHMTQAAACPLDLAEFTNRITRALQAPDLATQQEVIRLLIERIVVTDDALTVEHVVPTVNDSRLQLTCCEP